MGNFSRDIEHILERLWICDEEGAQTTVPELLKSARNGVEETHVQEARSLELVEMKNGHVRLTPFGKRHATLVIRRHRLAERLLHDLLEVGDRESASSACGFEHCLSDEVTTSICTLLGHPTTCPHGGTIPPGDCCAEALKQVGPLFMALSDLPAGESGRVMYIAGAHHGRLDRLSAIGLVPGSRLHLMQRRPSFVIQINETQVAIDEEIARDIHVRPEGKTRSRRRDS